MQNKLKDFNWKTTPGTRRHSTARRDCNCNYNPEWSAQWHLKWSVCRRIRTLVLQLNSIVGGKAERTAGLQTGGAGQTLVDQVGAPTTKIDTQSGHTIMPCGRVGSARLAGGGSVGWLALRWSEIRNAIPEYDTLYGNRDQWNNNRTLNIYYICKVQRERVVYDDYV